MLSRLHTRRLVGNAWKKPAGASFVRPLSTSSSGEQEGAKKSKGGSEIPWGLLFVVAFVGSIGGYFYRGKKNQQNLRKLQNEMLDKAALDKDEVEEIRTENKLTIDQLEQISRIVRQRWPSGKAGPREFFSFVGKVVSPDTEKLKADHLLERFALQLEEVHDKYDVDLLLTSMSMAVDSTIDERIEALFKVHAKSQSKMETDELLKAVDNLIATHQLPIRSLTREINKYPFNLYEPTGPLFLTARAVDEVFKWRKKHKALEGHEEGLKTALDENLAYADKLTSIKRSISEELQASENSEKLQKNGADVESKLEEQVAKLGPEPELPKGRVWTKKDFADFVYSKAICAWGECHAHYERLEEEARQKKRA